jgi:hypothetical protein
LLVALFEVELDVDRERGWVVPGIGVLVIHLLEPLELLFSVFLSQASVLTEANELLQVVALVLEARLNC